MDSYRSAYCDGIKDGIELGKEQSLKDIAKIITDYSCNRMTAENTLWKITLYVSERIKEQKNE